jgi:hypothetical protein
MDILQRIKQLVLRGRVGFARKALEEMRSDGLRIDDVTESIICAQTIAKTLRSKNPNRRYPGEKLYVIKSFSFDGTPIYTKGAIVRKPEGEVFYFLVSSKIVTFGD